MATRERPASQAIRHASLDEHRVAHERGAVADAGEDEEHRGDPHVRRRRRTADADGHEGDRGPVDAAGSMLLEAGRTEVAADHEPETHRGEHEPVARVAGSKTSLARTISATPIAPEPSITRLHATTTVRRAVERDTSERPATRSRQMSLAPAPAPPRGSRMRRIRSAETAKDAALSA